MDEKSLTTVTRYCVDYFRNVNYLERHLW
jgi:hypothetical protein